jgi:putative flippase GtrA
MFRSNSSLRSIYENTFVRYAAVGACAAFIQLSLLTILVEAFSTPPLLASTLALSIAIFFNYCMQRRITFRSRAKHHVAGPRFLAITLSTLTGNAVLFSALSAVLPYLIAQILTLGMIFPINYQLNKRITFRT